MHVNKISESIKPSAELIKMNIRNVMSNAAKMQKMNNFIKIVNSTKFQTMVFLR